jgi:hypothetical protein
MLPVGTELSTVFMAMLTLNGFAVDALGSTVSTSVLGLPATTIVVDALEGR